MPIGRFYGSDNFAVAALSLRKDAVNGIPPGENADERSAFGD
jgi:hypothetical protein